MRDWNGVTFCLLLLCALPVAAKDKKKILLTDALRAPAVRAVDEFRKVIAEAETQRANKP